MDTSKPANEADPEQEYRFDNLRAELDRLQREGILKKDVLLQNLETSNPMLHQRMEAARLRERQKRESPVKLVRDAAYQKLREEYQRLARENGLASEVAPRSQPSTQWAPPRRPATPSHENSRGAVLTMFFE